MPIIRVFMRGQIVLLRREFFVKIDILIVIMQNFDSIISQFDIPEEDSMNLEQDGKNGLSQVYFIGQKYVLRWRPINENTYSDFLIEQSLLSKITGEWLVGPINIPHLIRTKLWKFYFSDGINLWTLAKFIPGNILCGINDVYKLTTTEKRLYIEWLSQIQQKTKTIKPIKSHFCFTEWVRERYATVQTYFTLTEQKIIEKTLLEVSNMKDDEMCFVHGDYHPGNILVHQNTIKGLIDLDWCHIWSLYEDLSFIILVFIRDITQPHFNYSEAAIHELIDLYPWKIDISKLKKYILLRWVHDLSFFVPRSGWWMDKMKEIQVEIIKSFIK